MPVVHLRIDNRLIHGQVTVAWVGQIGADYLLVVNDDVAKDEFQKVLLPQAARGVRTSVVSVDEAVKICAAPEAATQKIMIIAKFPSDALRLLEAGVQVAEINVGNQAPKPGTKFQMVSRSIAVTKEEADVYRAIAGYFGGRLTSKMMVNDKPADFLELLAKKKL